VAAVRSALNRIRRVKDELELERMRAAERATSAGFAAAAALIEPGRTEREVQIELEAEFLRHGADFLAFDTIVGGGPNAAVLHFPPSPRRLGEQELVLIDAAAEVRGYASDITRTYPVSGCFSSEQAELYEIVRDANAVATAACVPGTEWRDVHRGAALRIAEGLGSFGLLRGAPDTLVDSGAVHVFFPHGVGHMVGLGVRDAGEVLPHRQRLPKGFPSLRVDLPLQPGYTVTIEPGVYFVPALLGDPDVRARHARSIDWDRAERMLGFGGIRIEDNVLVTAEGPEVLTADVPVPVPA
jgi:Xaa-Pro aminopeptidase